jgi:hypothetical protein
VVVLTVIYVNRFSTIQSVVSHLQQEHHIEVINQTLSFKNSTAFNEWKMKVMEDTTTGQVVVEYCPTHNSHSTELAHLPIPIDIKHVSDSI